MSDTLRFDFPSLSLCLPQCACVQAHVCIYLFVRFIKWDQSLVYKDIKLSNLKPIGSKKSWPKLLYTRHIFSSYSMWDKIYILTPPHVLEYEDPYKISKPRRS